MAPKPDSITMAFHTDGTGTNYGAVQELLKDDAGVNVTTDGRELFVTVPYDLANDIRDKILAELTKDREVGKSALTFSRSIHQSLPEYQLQTDRKRRVA